MFAWTGSRDGELRDVTKPIAYDEKGPAVRATRARRSRRSVQSSRRGRRSPRRLRPAEADDDASHERVRAQALADEPAWCCARGRDTPGPSAISSVAWCLLAPTRRPSEQRLRRKLAQDELVVAEQGRCDR
jgi:hypothetical protein